MRRDTIHRQVEIPRASWPPVDAEFESTCMGCFRPIRVGVRIRYVDGHGWMHSRCVKRVIARVRDEAQVAAQAEDAA